MGSTTVKRLLVLVGVIALLVVGGVLLWHHQVERMARGVVARAEQAEKDGDLARAAELYQEHLAVVPGDVEVSLKYAELIIKADRSAKRLGDALAIFEDVLGQYPARAAVRRRAADVALEMGAADRAHGHLSILLAQPGGEGDGHLEYLMARCKELVGEIAGGEGAEKYYRSAIEHGAPERLEASQHLAMLLLRQNTGKKDAADKVIDEMVKSAPEDYRAYLGRGRYREGLRDVEGAAADFREALKRAPDRPEVYLEVARSVRRDKGSDAARQVLEEGLARAPRAIELYLALSQLELDARAGAGPDDRAATDRAAAALERGLKDLPDRLDLRVPLALLLAERGDAGRLLLQIDELERRGAPRPLIQYLRAYYLVDCHEFLKARQMILGSLQTDVAPNPSLRAKVNILLARCNAELNEPELAAEAMLRAYSANPRDAAVRLGWIQELINRGAIEEAIRQYRGLEQDQPGLVRLPLAALLIEQNRRLPKAQRQWAEAEKLIADAEAAAPGSAEPALLRVELLRAMGEETKALEGLAAARERFPRDARPWIAEARLLIGQKKFAEAQGLLDRAKERFGDRADLRLVRLQLAADRGGPQVARTLEELAGGLDRFTRDDRRRLLIALADGLVRWRDLEGATRAWSRLAEEEPESLGPRLRLFDLALLAGDDKQVEARITAVSQLDKQAGSYCEAQHLIWRARTASGPDAAKRKEEDRAEARVILNALKVSRPDWSKVPLALARLDREELAEAGADAARRQERMESAIAAYRRAIELGVRDPSVVRELVQLLFLAKRGSEVMDIFSQVPAAGLVASQVALEHDRGQAVEIARKAIAANPADLAARLWLARVLIADNKTDDAEAVLHDAVAADQADPDRWANLVTFLVQNRRLEKAEKAVDEAKSHIANAPLVMAQCCEAVSRAYGPGDPERADPWHKQARYWFVEAQKALKDPGDLTVRRRLAEFLIRTNHAAEAEGPLNEIMRAAGGRSTEATWARRLLAEVYALGDPPRIDDALALIADKANQPGSDAADLRILALVHEARGTPEGRRQAIEALRTLIGRGAAAPDDRRRLAVLLDAAGEWQQAREQFRELIQRTEEARDTDTLARRPLFMTLFFDALIRHHQSGGDADLAEARQLVEKLRPTQRNPMTTLVMEAQLDKAANRPEEAARRFRLFADRPELRTAGRLRLAETAEQLGLFDAAEAILRRVAAEPPVAPNATPNWSRLAGYLARRGRVKDAVDLCEARWADASRRAQVAAISVAILTGGDTPLDAAQIRRVIGWLAQARQQDPRAFIFAFELGTLYERLGDYAGAERQYRDAIRLGDRDGAASNNLAWLIALNSGPVDEALQLIDAAIKARGKIPEYLDTRGMIRLRADQGQPAVDDLETALRAAPSPPKYFHLAQAYLKLNDKEKARRVLEVGKNRGLPGGLHDLELPEYKKMNSELGKP
jgi:tetratricopeptide (TPR) repeat protein